MLDLPLQLASFLGQTTQRLRQLGLPTPLADTLDRLAEQVHEPCSVAIVGRMKAGKSTFLNALLGTDLATVGVTETTATVNRFVSGQPADPARPVRCFWRNGTFSDEGPDFVASLHGHDADTLRRAAGVQLLEYRLRSPALEQITLIDTPGLSTVVEEHVEQTAEFLALRRQLAQQHSEETLRLGQQADAVIYLVGPVARLSDRSFLDEFAEVTGGRARALNAIGVLAKVDLHDDLLRRRHELADTIASQLRDQLNAVVPVSAGIRRAVDRLVEAGQASMREWLGGLASVPRARLNKMLRDEEWFREGEWDDCPLSPEQRSAMLEGMPWAVFTTLVQAAQEVGFEPEATLAAWETLAGFDRLRGALDRHLVRRGRFLRCHRIVGEARRVLEEVRYRHLPARRQHDRQEGQRLERFRGFLQRAWSVDAAVAEELQAYLQAQAGSQTAERLAVACEEMERQLAGLGRTLEEWNEDFAVLQVLNAHAARFTPEELAELRALFGLYGPEPAQRWPAERGLSWLASRQQHWLRSAQQQRPGSRGQVAERAIAVYGSLLADMSNS